MKTKLYLALAMLLVAPVAFGAVVIMDDFENTDYAVAIGTLGVTGLVDNIQLSNSTDKTQGNNSLKVVFQYDNQEAWYKNSSIAKTLATPVDLTAMEVIRFDIKVPTAKSAMMMTINFEDELGFIARFEDYAIFNESQTEWATKAYRLSSLHKDQWVIQGRPFNLKKVTKVTFHILNQAASGADTLEFYLDNLRFETGHGIVNETVLADFESYANDAAIQAAWLPAFSTPAGIVSLSNNAYKGNNALKLNVSLPGRYTNRGAYFELPQVTDFSTALYFKVAIFGSSKLAGLLPTAHLYLQDINGRRVQSLIWNWPEKEEWMEIYLPFQNQGIEGVYRDNPEDTVNSWKLQYDGRSAWRQDKWDGRTAPEQNLDLTQVTRLILTIETQHADTPNPLDDVEIIYDNVTVGYLTDAPPAPPVLSDKNYVVNAIQVYGQGPTIDGEVNGTEWDVAVSPGCTGFVFHDAPGTAATEDPEIRALFDRQYLYVLYQVVANTYAPGASFAPPAVGYRDPTPDFGGNTFDLFFSPEGNVADFYYHTVLFPYPNDGRVYVWDEAGVTYPGAASWDGVGDQAAFTYNSGSKLLTIEYRIPWSAFNMPASPFTSFPVDGTEWGVQIGYINTSPAEAVNWEPDTTAGFAAGRPFGTWIFTGAPPEPTAADSWNLYQ